MNRKLAIHFVPATENSKNDTFNKSLEHEEPLHELKKPNASEMYQEVLSMPSTSSQRSVNTRTTRSTTCRPPLPVPKPTFKSKDIFRFCQYGEVKHCKQWLTWGGGDVNARDQFQWTPLMVAASGGHRRVVELLIKSGADPALTDSKSLNASDHASKSGHGHLVRVMEKLFEEENRKNQQKEAPTTQPEKPETSIPGAAVNLQTAAAPFECEVCGPVTGQSRDVHLLSITHQLKSNDFSSEQTRALGSFAHVNPRFMGYRMLRREGWNGYTGLGAREDGRKYPVQAQPNPGRACIGLPAQTAKPERVPETQPATSTPSFHRGKFRHRLKREDTKRRQFEAEYRRSFH